MHLTERILQRIIPHAQDVENPAVRKAYGTFASVVGIGCNLFLFVLKYIMGTFGNSVAILSDAFNNLSDSANCLIMLFGYKMAAKPADRKHPFGHGRAEYLTSMGIAVVILLMGLELLKDSVDKILHPEPVSFQVLILVSLIGSIAIKLGMAAFYHALGRRVQSGVLEASAKDSRNDCVATGSTILALLAALVTDWPVDGIIGIFVSILILKTGYDIIRDTMDDLLGRPADPELVKQIHEMLAEEPHILGIHDLMLHNYGPGHVIGSCHAEVRSDENFAQIHDVIDRAEREIQEKLGILMTIHMDPLELDNALVVQCAQQVREIIHGLDPNLSMHDFRLIAGERERNFIFDLVVPFDCMYENEELQELIEAALNEMEPVLCHAVITFDRDFAA
ncbi:putative uncharacterized protein [Ruminococcus sp. CAG:403]|nr:putative uncharacterized protein [Ruminococcus sp. CAG:403]